MKLFYMRGLLAALALLALGRGAQAQDPSSPFGSPSILPLPQSRSTVPAGYQASLPQATQIQTTVSAAAPAAAPAASGALGGYRQSLVTYQAPADAGPAIASPSDIGPSTAETIGSGMQANPWWKPWGNNSTTGQGIPAAMAAGSEAGCLSCNPCCGGGGARWFGSVGGIFMTRNTPNPLWTSYQEGNLPNQTLNSKQAGNGLWGGGGQVTFGRWWCPCCSNPCSCGPQYAYGIQFTYWQIADMSSFASTQGYGQYGIGTPFDMTTGTPPTFHGLSGPASTIDYYFDGATRQAVWRTDRFLNIELNGLVQPIYNNPGCFSCTLLAGFRYFRFQDILTYGSAKTTDDFNYLGGSDAAYIQSNVTNNLFGGQIGTLLNFAVTPRFGLFALPKGGVFGNQINVTNSCYTGQGNYAFNYHASQTVCSLMGELDTGFYWWMCPNAQLFFGWRVIGVSNVALADNQFPQYVADTKGWESVKPNGDLILTGGFGGVAFAF